MLDELTSNVIRHQPKLQKKPRLNLKYGYTQNDSFRSDEESSSETEELRVRDLERLVVEAKQRGRVKAREEFSRQIQLERGMYHTCDNGVKTHTMRRKVSQQ